MRRTAGLRTVVLLVAGPAGVARRRHPGDQRHGGQLPRVADGGTDATMRPATRAAAPRTSPRVAVDPRNAGIMVAGLQRLLRRDPERLRQRLGGLLPLDDGGASWSNSLVPGLPGRHVASGTASPAHGSCAAAGDPTQSFDGAGHLYYGFICFNRAKPTNGSIYVARYDDDGANYVRTVRVDRGTPSVWGLFQDKINIAADQSTGPHRGQPLRRVGPLSGPGGQQRHLSSRARPTAGDVLQAHADHPGTRRGAVRGHRSRPERRGLRDLPRDRASEVHPEPHPHRALDRRRPVFSAPRTVADDRSLRVHRLRPGHLRRRAVRVRQRPDLRALLEPVRGRGGRHRRARGLECADAAGQAKVFVRNSPDGLTGRRPRCSSTRPPPATSSSPTSRARRHAVGGLPGLARRPGVLARPAAGGHAGRTNSGTS